MQSAKGLKSHSREKGEGAVRGKKTKNQTKNKKGKTKVRLHHRWTQRQPLCTSIRQEDVFVCQLTFLMDCWLRSRESASFPPELERKKKNPATSVFVCSCSRSALQQHTVDRMAAVNAHFCILKKLSSTAFWRKQTAQSLCCALTHPKLTFALWTWPPWDLWNVL